MKDELEEMEEKEVPLTNWTAGQLGEGEGILTFPSARSAEEVGRVVPLPSALGPEVMFERYYKREGGSLPQVEESDEG